MDLLNLDQENQIKTFKKVGSVCVYIYIKKKNPSLTMKTKQTENLTAYACFLTFTAIRNCIGYTLCKAKSLFFFFLEYLE